MSEEINKAEETKVEEESLAAEETRMISDEARWYVVHTYSGYENKVKANIEKTVENRGMQDQIFDRFFRVDKARSRESGGTGLGLSIAREIVQRHHGTIALAPHEGPGTTIRLTLPIGGPSNPI